MTDHNLFYYPYAFFTNAQISLLKVAALYFDKLVVLDPVGASWNTIGTGDIARDAVRLLKNADILEIVTLATVLAKYEDPIAEAIQLGYGRPRVLESLRSPQPGQWQATLDALAGQAAAGSTDRQDYAPSYR
jgi:hypothetical protein